MWSADLVHGVKAQKGLVKILVLIKFKGLINNVMRIMLNLPLKCKTYYIILIIYGKKIIENVELSLV